jgi:hypothetical protein
MRLSILHVQHGVMPAYGRKLGGLGVMRTVAVLDEICAMLAEQDPIQWWRSVGSKRMPFAVGKVGGCLRRRSGSVLHAMAVQVRSRGVKVSVPGFVGRQSQCISV